MFWGYPQTPLTGFVAWPSHPTAWIDFRGCYLGEPHLPWVLAMTGGDDQPASNHNGRQPAMVKDQRDHVDSCGSQRRIIFFRYQWRMISRKSKCVLSISTSPAILGWVMVFLYQLVRPPNHHQKNHQLSLAIPAHHWSTSSDITDSFSPLLASTDHCP